MSTWNLRPATTDPAPWQKKRKRAFLSMPAERILRAFGVFSMKAKSPRESSLYESPSNTDRRAPSSRLHRRRSAFSLSGGHSFRILRRTPVPGLHRHAAGANERRYSGTNFRPTSTHERIVSPRAAPLTICSRGGFTARSEGRISATAASTNSNTSATRIAMLDFVLGNLDLDYLETEPDKVAYFCRELQLPKQHLPSKTYSGRYTVTPTVRYFVDRYPMFFPASFLRVPDRDPHLHPGCRGKPDGIRAPPADVSSRCFASFPSSGFSFSHGPMRISPRPRNCSAISSRFRSNRIPPRISCAISRFAKRGIWQSTRL